MNLSVHLFRVRAATFVVTVAGDLDLYTAPLLSPSLIPPPGPGPCHIVLAASRLSFCDVAGLRLLTSAHRTLSETGGGLAIAGASASMRRLTPLVAGSPSDAPVHFAGVTEALRACAEPGGEDFAGPPPASRHLPSFRGLGAGRAVPAGLRARRHRT
ncbi:STAS domain-containing protein [Streptosporangium sp. NPDC050855]|uniref:STAS domain-containing protein n=1 Tax=Streptosporangium sp. NPDC050855 TaxID=3366194 RepID=UPI00378BFE27